MATDTFGKSLAEQSAGPPKGKAGSATSMMDQPMAPPGPVSIEPVALPQSATPVAPVGEAPPGAANPLSAGTMLAGLSPDNPAAGVELPGPIASQPTPIVDVDSVLGAARGPGEMDAVLMGLGAGASRPWQSTGDLLLNMGVGAFGGLMQHRQQQAAKKAASEQQQFDNQIKLLEVAAKFEGDTKAQSAIGKLAADLRQGKITQEEYDTQVALWNKKGSTTVNVNTGEEGLKGRKEYEKKLMGEIFDDQKLARQQNQHLGTLEAQLNNFETGFGGNFRQFLGKFAVYAGIEQDELNRLGIGRIVNADGTANFEIINNITRRLAQEAFANAKGNLNRQEFEYFRDTYSRISSTVEGNRMMIELLRRENSFKIEKAKFLGRWFSQGYQTLFPQGEQTFQEAWEVYAMENLDHVKLDPTGQLVVDGADLMAKAKRLEETAPAHGAPAVAPFSADTRRQQLLNLENPGAGEFSNLLDRNTLLMLQQDPELVQKLQKRPGFEEAFIAAANKHFGGK